MNWSICSGMLRILNGVMAGSMPEISRSTARMASTPGAARTIRVKPCGAGRAKSAARSGKYIAGDGFCTTNPSATSPATPTTSKTFRWPAVAPTR